MAKVAGFYTRYKPIVRKLPAYRKTWVKNLADQIQMDLVDMQKYSKENGGNRWILTSIEILSRYAFAIPVYGKDTKNMTVAVRKLLRQFHDRFGTYPKLTQFDDGKEFYNVGVKDLLDKHDIKFPHFRRRRPPSWRGSIEHQKLPCGSTFTAWETPSGRTCWKNS